MELNEYQKKALTTCMPSCDNFAYMMLNLVGEVGEFASKVAKSVRREEIEIELNKIVGKSPAIEVMEVGDWMEWDAELMKEAGDILWQLSGLCNVMGWTLNEVATANLQKLADRKKRNVIDGNGDNR